MEWFRINANDISRLIVTIQQYNQLFLDFCQSQIISGINIYLLNKLFNQSQCNPIYHLLLLFLIQIKQKSNKTTKDQFFSLAHVPSLQLSMVTPSSTFRTIGIHYLSNMLKIGAMQWQRNTNECKISNEE
ncbi:Hypothetical_protein [Hexamita inflata]|uniref:Hypothetical_protein n=1 Tax=Hexamita inflata TaxID=28002 RepID=A0AA86UXD6_9EUKA|nr:Hypothetical protein HINF_LOCUS56132 [Hexamita inflata]